MKKYRQYLGLFFLVFLLPQVCFAQTTNRHEMEASIDAVFSEYQGIPGCAIGIFKKGQILLKKGYGIANMDYNIPIESQTVFEIASLSKHFTAACIILLENEGKLSLDDPIQKFLPEMPVYPEGEIKIRHLLNHTSGVREYLKLLYAKGLSWNGNFDNQKGIELLIKQRGINFVPGDRYAYSNSGYLLLAEIVARVSEMSLGEFAKARVFEPLGMQNTFFYENSGSIVPNRAIGYIKENGDFKREHYFNAVSIGDGGVNTTIEDYFKWSENFKSSKIGGESFVKKMLTKGKLNNGEEIRYASGLFLGPYRGLASIGHDGTWAGFRSLFFKFPEEDISFVILSNNGEVNVWRLLDALVEIVMEKELAQVREAMSGNGAVPQGRKSIQLTARELEKYAGNYFNDINGYSRAVFLKNDTLVYRRPDSRENKLIPFSSDAFRFLGLPQVELRFSKASDEEQLLTLHIDNSAPIILQKYLPKRYKSKELNPFLGDYYSEELEVKYRISKINDALAIYIGANELLRLEAVTENLFNEEHFGYLKFEKDKNGKVYAFTINDELAKDIRFTKLQDA